MRLNQYQFGYIYLIDPEYKNIDKAVGHLTDKYNLNLSLDSDESPNLLAEIRSQLSTNIIASNSISSSKVNQIVSDFIGLNTNPFLISNGSQYKGGKGGTAVGVPNFSYGWNRRQGANASKGAGRNSSGGNGSSRK